MNTNCLAMLIAALIRIESGGDPLAVGDDGRSWGCLQIRPSVIADVNRVYGLSYSSRDAFCSATAPEICRLYLMHWGARQKIASAEDYARIWNGGPLGHQKQKTRAYWKKVRPVYLSMAFERRPGR